jgi:hypothetical protein
MQKITLAIRVDEEDKKRWEDYARAAGSNGLSAWIRETLNDAAGGTRKVMVKPEEKVEREMRERRYEDE